MNPDDSQPKAKEIVPPDNRPVANAPKEEGGELKSALQKMSQEKPQILQEIMAMSFSSGVNPLHQKMTEEHVTQVLNLVTSHDERQFQLSKDGAASDSEHRNLTTWFAFIGALAFLGLLIFIILTFKDKPEVLVPILTGIGGFIAGGLGGFGYGKAKSKE